MLNATNAEDYLATNAKLQVREMGPYVYRRREIKLDVSLSDDVRTTSLRVEPHVVTAELDRDTSRDDEVHNRQTVEHDVQRLHQSQHEHHESCDGCAAPGYHRELRHSRAFSSYANCVAPTANVTCLNVSGSDGSAIKPSGVTNKGMAKHTTVDTFDSYLGPAEISIPMESLDTEVDFNGVSLHRFGTP
ncbi:hypothetical protein PF010_g28902, partial [Phytophthora fragariae]